MPRKYVVTIAATLLAGLAACGGSSGDRGSPSGFCDTARSAKAAADVQQKLFDAQDAPPPSEVQPAIEDFAAKFAAMSAAAPAEIKADVATIDAAAQQLLSVVRANGFDVVAMISTPEFTALTNTFSGDAYQSAQDHFQTYFDTTCGITPTTGT